MATPVSADRNLLCGVLALHMDFITRDQLIDALSGWVADKATPLEELLRRRGWLAEEDQALLRMMVARHLERHGGDARQSLAAASIRSEVREDVERTLAPEERGWSTPAGRTHSQAEDGPLTAGPPVPNGEVGSRYRRLRAHARGGLGEVSVALDTELQREVALKEIQAALADQPTNRARFVREAEITGQLEHPGVVPIYGLGAYPDGRPYYAMRFIRGETLHNAVARFHFTDDGRRDPSERALALRSLLTRFVAVCNAVAYAHARGVIHRDLKPQNVMLGEYGETLVVDWGLAKVLDQPEGETAAERPLPPRTGSGSAPTEMGQALGTPAFMPPEQAEGKLGALGVASDVFALGATLYALLTGQAPYRGENVLSQAARGNAPPARQVNPRVPPPLEAICARAMRHEPKERYTSARQLAADVERWLADEPVSAYRDPFWERTRRWARRNRTTVTTLGALLLASVLGLSGGLFAIGREQQKTAQARDEAQANYVEAKRNLERASKAETTATAHLKQAERNLQLAKQAVDECFGVAEKHPQLQGDSLREVRHLLFAKARPFYQNFRAQRPDDLRLQWEEAKNLHQLGHIEAEIGSKEKALELFRQARVLRAALADKSPQTPAFRADVAVSLRNMATLLRELDRTDEARAAFVEAERLLLPLVARWPADRSYRSDLAGILSDYSGVLHARAKPEESLRVALRSRDLRMRLVAERPDDHWSLYALGAVHSNIGANLRDLGRREEMLRALQHARDLQARLVQANPEVSNYRRAYSVALGNLGLALADLGRREQAVTALRQARDINRDLIAAYPRVTFFRESLALWNNNLGTELQYLGRQPEALAAHQAAREQYQLLVNAERTIGQNHHGLAASLNAIGNIYRQTNRRAEAAKAFLQARDICLELTKKHPKVPRYQMNLAGSYFNLGLVYSARETADLATENYRKASEIAGKLVAAYPKVPEYLVQQARAEHNLSIHFFALGDPKGSLGAARNVATLRARLVAAFPSNENYRFDLANAHYRLARLLTTGRNNKEPINHLTQAITHLTAVPSERARDPRFMQLLPICYYVRARHYLDAGKLRESLADWDAFLAAAPPTMRGEGRLRRGDVLARLGEYRRALADVRPLVEQSTLTGPARYDLACVYALCAAAVARDAGLPLPQRERDAEAHARQAVALLRRAAATGYFGAAAQRDHMDRDPDLDGLRSRADFRAFVAGLPRE